MNKQRKVLITITYNEMGIITDTKAEEVIQPETNCSEIPNSSDTISRQQAIDALDCINGAEEVLRSLPPAQPEPQWILCDERMPEEDGKYMVTIHGYGWNGKTFTSVSVAECIGKRWVGNNGVIAWIPLPKPYEGEGEQE